MITHTTRGAGLLMIMLIVMLPICFAAELSLVYDANGNLISGDSYARTYNSLNQLTEVRNSTGSLLEEFSYHPVEERILVKKVYLNEVLSETIYYVDENFIRVVNASGSYDYTYVKHEGQLVAQLNPDGSKYYVHSDHEGSSTVITNQAGAVVENTLYEPFGEVISGVTMEGKIKVPGNMDKGEILYYLKKKIETERGINSLVESQISDSSVGKVYAISEINYVAPTVETKK